MTSHRSPTHAVRFATTDDRPVTRRLLYSSSARWRRDPRTPEQFRASTTSVDGETVDWSVHEGGFVCHGAIAGALAYRATLDDLRPYVGEPSKETP